MLRGLKLSFIVPLVLIHPAFASTETLGFTGTSTSFCTLTKTGDGTMIQNAAGTRLTTTAGGGAAAGFTIATNASSVLDLDDALVVVTEPSGFTPVRTPSIRITDDASGLATYVGAGDPGDSVTITGPSTGVVNLAITDSSNAKLPAGSYSYSKTITCTAP